MGGRPAELNERKGDKDLEREIKKGEIFLLKEQHENFVAVVRNASGHQSNARCKWAAEKSELEQI